MNEAADEEAKEMYARYGLAIYCSCVLEHGLANALLILESFKGRGGATTREEWENLVDKHYEDTFAKTMGALLKRIDEQRSLLAEFVDIKSDLDKCLSERNYLVHHFWREHAEHWFTAPGRATMVTRLEKARDLFSDTDHKLEDAIQPIASRNGLSPEVVRGELDRMWERLSKDDV